MKVSDPRFESDNLRHITIKTDNLKGRGNICVYVPPHTEADDLPIVILLHGVYGSAQSWSKQAGAHRTAQRMIEEGLIAPCILAMPSDGLWGDGSAYMRHSGCDFEKWICEDVIDAVKLLIPQAVSSNKIFISGLSMGGFGTLYLGAKYPMLFSGMSAHSAITSISQMPLFVEETLDRYELQDDFSGDVKDLIIANRDEMPPLRFDCGVDDILIEYNRALHVALVKNNIEHIYQEFSGAHEWPYWEEHLEDTLKFFSALL